MTKQEIIEKIRLAEEISSVSKQFPEMTYKIVLNFLLAIKIKEEPKAEKQAKKSVVKKHQKDNTNKSAKGLSQKINDLILEGYFNQAKTSKEIIKKLKLMGYTMQVTSLPSYLIPKIRNNELIREEIKTKNGKIYGYTRKNK